MWFPHAHKENALLVVQIILGSMMVIATTIIQSGFTVAAVRMLHLHVSHQLPRSLWHSTLMLALFVLWLFLATILQVWASSRLRMRVSH